MCCLRMVQYILSPPFPLDLQTRRKIGFGIEVFENISKEPVYFPPVQLEEQVLLVLEINIDRCGRDACRPGQLLHTESVKAFTDNYL